MSAKTYAVNQAKWKAAVEFCEDQTNSIQSNHRRRVRYQVMARRAKRRRAGGPSYEESPEATWEFKC